LENGLKVLFNKDPISKKVYLNVYVKSGAVDDPPGKKGLAHLYEHLALRKGEGNSFFRGMDNIGMYYNARTAYDYMFFRSEGPGVHFHKSLELESLRFGKVHEGLSQNSIDNEIEIIRSEALESYKNPIGCLDSIIRKSLFIQPEPYAWDILGDYCDLRSVKVHDIEQYGQQHFSPDNTVIFSFPYNPKIFRKSMTLISKLFRISRFRQLQNYKSQKSKSCY
jgi:predicted Zn-dependent peptidase